jgi:hypothetical protein
MTRPDGTTDGAAAARYVATHPLMVPKLAKLGRDTKMATQAAAAAAVAALA